jgi:hypothetical protein
MCATYTFVRETIDLAGKCYQQQKPDDDDGYSYYASLVYISQFDIYLYFRIISVVLNFICCAVALEFCVRESNVWVSNTSLSGQLTLGKARDSAIKTLVTRFFWYPIIQSISFVGVFWWETQKRSFDSFTPAQVTGYEFFLQMLIVVTSPLGGIGFLVIFLNFQPKATALVVRWVDMYCPILLRLAWMCPCLCSCADKPPSPPSRTVSSANSVVSSSTFSSAMSSGLSPPQDDSARDTAIISNSMFPGHPSALNECRADLVAAVTDIWKLGTASMDEYSIQSSSHRPSTVSVSIEEGDSLLTALSDRLSCLGTTDEDGLLKIIDDVGRELARISSLSGASTFTPMHGDDVTASSNGSFVSQEKGPQPRREKVNLSAGQFGVSLSGDDDNL